MENKKTPNGHEMLQAYKKYLKALKRYNKYIDMINEEIFSL